MKKKLLALVLSMAMAVTGLLPMMPAETVSAAETANKEIHVYAETPGDTLSSKYTLTANETNIPVVKYSANGNNFDIARFASNDTTPEYTVTVANEIIHTVTVYPERYYKKDTLVISEDKHSVTFTLSKELPYVYVMINGGPADQAGKPYLAIINDPLEVEEDIPSLEAANVLNAKTFMESYLEAHPNSEAQSAELAGITSGGTAYEAGELVSNETAQVRFPDKRLMLENDMTYALQAALDEIYKEGSPYDTLYFPSGTYTWSGLEIRNRKGKDVTIYVEEGALLKNRIQECMQAMEPAIGIWDSEDITISGRGIFDGNGVENYKKDRHDAKDSCHQGGVMIVRSSDITFNDTYVRDAKQWNWESHNSKNCTLNNIKGLTPYNQPWVDGLDMASAQNLIINGAITLGNDDNFASGHYNPSDGFLNTVPGYDQYNSDCLTWDTEDSYNVSVNNTLGWSFGGGNGVRMGHNTYGHKMLNYSFTNVNTTNFTGGGNGITIQKGTGNSHPYPYYENITFTNCSFDTTRVGTNMNIHGLNAANKIGEVTVDNCWFSNGANNSYIEYVEDLTIKNLYVGQNVTLSSQAKVNAADITTQNYDWIVNEAPVFVLPAKDTYEVTAETELAFNVSATDTDAKEDEKVILSAADLPEGADFDAATGEFTWKPAEEQVGGYTVTFVAADAYETREKKVQITVHSSKYKTIALTATADATVKAWKTEKTDNYGTQDYIRTMRMGDSIVEGSAVGVFGEGAGTNTSDTRDAKISFISFDASNLAKYKDDLQKAELVLTYIGRRESGITGEDKLLAAKADGALTEGTVTWNTMPVIDAANVKSSDAFSVDGNGVVMAQDAKYNTNHAIDGTRVKIDITEFVTGLEADAKTLTLAICDENGWELAFVSKEGVTNMSNATEDMAPVIALTVDKAAEEIEKPEVTLTSFVPNDQWSDTNGTMIQAHGGGVIWDENTQKYYWYGENKGEEKTSTGGIVAIGVSCYSSTDLYNWTYEGMALPVFNNPAFLEEGKATDDTPLYLPESAEEYQLAKAAGLAVSEYDTLEKYNITEEIEAFNALYADATAAEKQELYNKLNWNCVMERPKVIYNKKNDNYVMWFHKDGEGIGTYDLAQTGIAVSDSPTGPFKLIDTIRPNGAESRDMTLFVDDDGKAYLFHSAEDNWTLYIAELNEDYTGLTGLYSRNYVDKGGSKGVYAREAPAIFKEDGKYYVISSGCTGWRPNEMGYSVTEDIRKGMSTEGGNGPFQMDDLRNPCVGADAATSFGGQSTFVLPVQGKEGCYIYMGDKWNSTNLKDSRYQWLPIQIDSENSALTILWSDEWKLDDFETLNSVERVELNRIVKEAAALSANDYDYGQQSWGDLQELITEGMLMAYDTTTEELAAKTEAIKKAIAEVKAYVPVEVELEEINLAGKIITTDSYQSGNEAEKAIDGDTSTIWHNAWSGTVTPLPHYVSIDLGESYNNLYQLNYLPRQDKDSNGIVTKYRILVSEDNTNFTEVRNGSWAEDKTEKTAIFSTNGAVRYIRFEVIEGVGGYASAAELRLFTGTEKSSGGNGNQGEENKPDDNKPVDNEQKAEVVKVSKISIGADSKKIAAGMKVQLSVEVLPKNAANTAVQWISGNEKYAAVSNTGLVTTKKAGKGKTVTITAKAKDGSGVIAEIRIQIMKNAVKKITIKNAPKTLKAGRKITLKTNIKTNGKKANKTLRWVSSNTKFATVNAKGKVVTKKAGKGKTVKITAYATDGTNKKATVRIKLK
ncbi:MAG: discoidin domain-containing protein [Lachnospiraceae bacterium]|nr:discoidin domain-containing protein [Lachnospiraceae bacterium]